MLNKSSKKLKRLVRNNDIIVCKTDKDGKLVIIDLATYNNIMKRELEQFQELDISQNDFEKKAAMVRKKCENFPITLRKEQVMDNNLLYHTTGLKIAEYCQTQIDEYCQDTKNYLKVLTERKTNQMKKPKQTESLHLVAADVTALYPTISRNLVGQALKKALQVVSPFSQKAIKSIVKMVMFCLENVITQFGKKFYKQKTGIVAGDNHSISLANIVMHFIIEQIRGNLKRTELFRRYIDDIFFISFGFSNTKSIQTGLTNIFQNNGLTLTFREVNNRQTGQGVEFLDVFHQIEEDNPIGFVTKNFTKPTAAGRTFLHGNSYHPLLVFKDIIFSEAVRLRRLNERQEDYINSINELKDKCLSSGFNKKVTQTMIQKVSTWTERFGPTNQKKQTEKNPIPWATSFPQFLQLTDKERSIKPEANVIYKTPHVWQIHQRSKKL